MSLVLLLLSAAAGKQSWNDEGGEESGEDEKGRERGKAGSA